MEISRALRRYVEQLEAEYAANQHEMNRLHELIDVVPGGISWKDNSGYVLGVNTNTFNNLRSLGVVTGNNKDAAQGICPWGDLFTENTAEMVYHHDHRVLDRQESRVWIENFMSRTGVKHRYISTRCPMFDDAGELCGILGTNVMINAWSTVTDCPAIIR